jgi:hypothetical protein
MVHPGSNGVDSVLFHMSAFTFLGAVRHYMDRVVVVPMAPSVGLVPRGLRVTDGGSHFISRKPNRDISIGCSGSIILGNTTLKNCPSALMGTIVEGRRT